MTIRLYSYNIEWFDRLFSSSNVLKTGQQVTARFDAIAAVLRHTDADLVGIVKHPTPASPVRNRQ